MINLEAALMKRKLSDLSGGSSSSSSRNVYRREPGCFFDGMHLLLFNILSRLPVKCLMKCKSVCRFWRYLIKHNTCFIDLHLTMSKNHLLDEHTFLMYPALHVNRPIPVKRFLFCPKDLRFDDCHGHESLDNDAIVTSNNVALDEKPVSMLEPVNGLVCFVKGGSAVMEHCSVQIHNPSTRDKTPWIDTLTNAAFRKLFGVKLVKGCRRDRLKSSYEYMFGFGVDPVTNKHKVFCMIEITVTRRIEEIVSRELVCGVFTLGENTWRKIEQVPPETTIKKNSVHVGGSTYWISGKKPRCENGVIMAFDLGSETFRSITIPNPVLDHWGSIERLQLVHELAEVDGRLCVLVREGDDILNLWIHTIDNGGSDTNKNWTEETLQLPCHWDKIHNLAFKAITGTSLVVLKFLKEERYAHQFRCEVLQYYDRSEKKFYKNSFEILLDPTGTTGGTYSITPFFETLLPV